MGLSAAQLKMLGAKGFSLEEVILFAEASGTEDVLAERRSRDAKRKRDKRSASADVSADSASQTSADAPPASSPNEILTLTPSTTPKSSLRSDSVKAAERAFDEFWEIYPRKVQKDAAKKAFAKVLCSGRTSIDTVMAGVRAHATRSIGKSIEFIPHAATWLNAGGFDDEEPQAASAQARPTVSGTKTTTGFWLHREDPRFEAWTVYKRSIGKTQAVDGNGGWTFPTEAPPAELPKPPAAKQLEFH